MNSKQEIIMQINNDLGNSPKAEICVSILDYLLRVPRLSHITYGSLRKVIGDKYKDEDLAALIPYLTGDQINLLEANWELIENNDVFSLLVSQVKDADKTKVLYHPDTGELVENFEDKVFIYFSPSHSIKKVALNYVER